VSARDGLSERLLLGALATELARLPSEGQMRTVLLIGMQSCATISEANALAGLDWVRLLHLDGAAGGFGCGLGNAETLYDADAITALPAGSFRVVGLNVEAARSYRVLREVALWAAARAGPDGCLLLAGPRKGGAEVAAEALRPVVAQLDLLGYRKGHRVYRATVDQAPSPQPPPTHAGGGWGEEVTGTPPTQSIELRGQTLQLVQDDRIFARGQLDPATRLLAETFEVRPAAALLDLGCGNGVLGILAALLDPTSHCTLVDADPLAVAAARRSAALSGATNVTVQLSNLLDALPGQTFDMVLMNPPFHRGRREDRALGERFLRDAAAALRPGGQMWIVCNRFLPYERVLRQLLSGVREAAADRSYKVLTGTR
jgi:16S rRNA (guanine1207-N2)-methyltransferase